MSSDNKAFNRFTLELFNIRGIFPLEHFAEFRWTSNRH